MKIKVCGITTPQQMVELNDLGVDYVGLIFYKPSKRSMVSKLSPVDVNIPGLTIKKTGVFVNESADYILEQVEKYNLNSVQLHGDETVAFCNHISNYIKVIKAFRIGDDIKDIDRLVYEYIDACDYYLFDKSSLAVFGGTGEKFEWSVLAEAKINKPFFLSGGITLEDAEELQKFQHPFLHSLDINSRFETEPGIKNMGMVREFVTKIRTR